MPEISVIMPAYIDTYDKLDWMQEALQSVKDQSFKDWEVIIIDDSSPISLGALQNEFNPPKFRWFKTVEQSGPAACRNTAVELSQSKNAIFPLDADDKLPHENVLNVLYTEWSNNPNVFYYGNLQKHIQDSDQEDTILNLVEYTFRSSLNKHGIMPVSCIFSYDCWLKAGGWSTELEAGREDVEFNIKLGKVGCCGKKINETTLIYRRHETSRDYHLREISGRESEMVNRIRLMHQDVYGGKFPMDCCGGGNRPLPKSNNGNRALAISALDGYPDSEKVWVEYAGGRSGGFGVTGKSTGIEYNNISANAKFQVHTSDLMIFKNAGRGRDFIIGVSPPTNFEPVAQQGPEAYEPPLPTFATIEQFDTIAAS